MTNPPARNGHRRMPPFLIPGFLVVIVILSFNYWRTSRLNKSLLEGVAVQEARSQRLGNELTRARDTDTLQKAEHETEVTQLRNTLTDLKKRQAEEVADVREELEALRTKLNELGVSYSHMESEKKLLEGKSQEMDQIKDENDELISKNKALNTTIVNLQTEKEAMISFVSDELGKAGIEHLLSNKVSLPATFVMPSADQQPQCTKRAEDEFKAAAAKNQQIIASNQPQQEIQSPNVDMKNVVKHLEEVQLGGNSFQQTVPNNQGNQGNSPVVDMNGQPVVRDVNNGQTELAVNGQSMKHQDEVQLGGNSFQQAVPNNQGNQGNIPVVDMNGQPVVRDVNNGQAGLEVNGQQPTVRYNNNKQPPLDVNGRPVGVAVDANSLSDGVGGAAPIDQDSQALVNGDPGSMNDKISPDEQDDNKDDKGKEDEVTGKMIDDPPALPDGVAVQLTKDDRAFSKSTTPKAQEATDTNDGKEEGKDGYVYRDKNGYDAREKDSRNKFGDVQYKDDDDKKETTTHPIKPKKAW